MFLALSSDLILNKKQKRDRIVKTAYCNLKLNQMNKVWIVDGCISCGLCSDLCPEVFRMEDVAVVIPGADLNANADKVIESAEGCPVEVIKYE